VTDGVTTIKATEVRVGDRIRHRLGAELTVTRIDRGFLDRQGYLAFVEDSDEQWMKMPAAEDADVQLVRRGDGVEPGD
jgi:hypothetical protein